MIVIVPFRREVSGERVDNGYSCMQLGDRQVQLHLEELLRLVEEETGL